VADAMIKAVSSHQKFQIPPDFVVNLYHVDIVDTIF